MCAASCVMVQFGSAMQSYLWAPRGWWTPSSSRWISPTSRSSTGTPHPRVFAAGRVNIKRIAWRCFTIAGTIRTIAGRPRWTNYERVKVFTTQKKTRSIPGLWCVQLEMAMRLLGWQQQQKMKLSPLQFGSSSACAKAVVLLSWINRTTNRTQTCIDRNIKGKKHRPPTLCSIRDVCVVFSVVEISIFMGVDNEETIVY